MTDLNTKITYQYRDGANNKVHGEYIIKGMVSVFQAERLKSLCYKENGENFFIPESVGMPSLLETPWDDEIDHPYHSIEDIEMVSKDPDDDRSIRDIIAAFSKCDWEKAALEHALERA